MPRADDLPAFEVDSFEVPTAVNPLGAKGVGEAGTVGALPALLNAVNDALAPAGVRHLDMPVTPARVWQAIDAGPDRRAGRRQGGHTVSDIGRITGVLSPVVTPFLGGPRPRSRPLRPPLPLAPVAGRRAGRLRHQLRGEFPLGGRADRAARPAGRRGRRPGAHDAGHRLLRPARHGAAHRACREARLRGVLMLPPFYYKGVSDEGLFRSFAEVIERVGEARLRVYLYHIPPVAQVAITLGLVERLLKAYPAQIAGMKDSSGDWNNTKAFLDAFAGAGFDVFAGSETFLLQNMRHGGAGCISATANVHPGAHRTALRHLAGRRRRRAAGAPRRDPRHVPEVPDDPRPQGRHRPLRRGRGLGHRRPPLVALTPEQAAALAAELDAKQFTMPGLRP